MNKDRRKALADLVKDIEALAQRRDELVSELEAIKDEEQEYFDAMPESLQSGEKGSGAEEAIGHLETACEALEELDFDSVTSAIEDASQ